MKTGQSTRCTRSGIRLVTRFVPLAIVIQLAACSDNNKSASQVIARVNSGEITVHQVNHLLQRTPNVTQDNAEAAKQAIVKRLVEQEVLVQQAQEQKLDRDPAVLMELESARREVLVRAYLGRVAGRGAKPTESEVEQYFHDNPDLFSKRRVYQFSEVTLDKTPANWNELQPAIGKANTLKEVLDVLNAHRINPSVSQNVVRPSEKLPLHLVPKFATNKVGDVIVYPLNKTVVIGQITAIKEVPVEQAQAKDAIRQFLLAKQRTERVKAEATRLKDAATIAYQVGFESLAIEQNAGQSNPANAVGSDQAESEKQQNNSDPKDGDPGLNSEALNRGLKGLK